MENGARKKNLNYIIRLLHRDIGFFLIGLTIIYSISGLLLVYRDTDLLKKETLIERQLETGLEESELGSILRIRNFKILKADEDFLYFENGIYNIETGLIKYTTKALPPLLEKIVKLHKINSSNFIHIVAVVVAILLIFLAISSFWMIKPKTKSFRRGIIFALSGFVFTIFIMFL